MILPLLVNTTVDCKWRDQHFILAKVVDRRPRFDKPEEYEYYVHYDRRAPLCRILRMEHVVAQLARMPHRAKNLQAVAFMLAAGRLSSWLAAHLQACLTECLAVPPVHQAAGCCCCLPHWHMARAALL